MNATTRGVRRFGQLRQSIYVTVPPKKATKAKPRPKGWNEAVAEKRTANSTFTTSPLSAMSQYRVAGATLRLLSRSAPPLSVPVQPSPRPPDMTIGTMLAVLAFVMVGFVVVVMFGCRR